MLTLFDLFCFSLQQNILFWHNFKENIVAEYRHFFCNFLAEVFGDVDNINSFKDQWTINFENQFKPVPKTYYSKKENTIRNLTI